MSDRSCSQWAYEKLQSSYCWIDLSLYCDIDANVIRWSVGFDLWVTNASIISSSLSGSVVKNLGYVFIIAFWTDSSAQLDLGLRNGISVILINTSQSIRNFLNCWRGGHFKMELGKLGRWCLSIDGLGRGLLGFSKDRQSFSHCCDSQLA